MKYLKIVLLFFIIIVLTNCNIKDIEPIKTTTDTFYMFEDVILRVTVKKFEYQGHYYLRIKEGSFDPTYIHHPDCKHDIKP